MAEEAWSHTPWNWMDWSAASRLPMVMQTEAGRRVRAGVSDDDRGLPRPSCRSCQHAAALQYPECALACLTMIAGYHGHHADLASMRRRFSTSA
ncbi:cysteine peptidase family C39 domain-containing protein [Xanthomonas sp. MUS 060]|uniref:cysteine peptidase family C39 domain-containing protein n=1 Tax=Xanthomonas sp. MUS 060 TaxID=1588031 RepID=UPI000AAD4C7F